MAEGQQLGPWQSSYLQWKKMSAMLSDIHDKICKTGEGQSRSEITGLGSSPSLQERVTSRPARIGKEVHRVVEGTGILPSSVLGAGPVERAREIARTGPIPSSIPTISSSRFSAMAEGTRLRTLEEGQRKTEHQVMQIMEAFEKTSKKLDEQQVRIEKQNAKLQEILNAQKMNEIQMKCMAAALSDISRELLRRPVGEAPAEEHGAGDDAETENLDPNLRTQGGRGVNSGLNFIISPGELVSNQDWNKICEISGSSSKEFPRGNELSSKPDFQTLSEFYYPLDSDVVQSAIVELMGNFDFGMKTIRRFSISPLETCSAYDLFDEMPVRGFSANQSSTQLKNAPLFSSNRVFDPGGNDYSWLITDQRVLSSTFLDKEFTAQETNFEELNFPMVPPNWL